MDQLFQRLQCKYHRTHITGVSIANEAPRRLLCQHCMEDLVQKGYEIAPVLPFKDCISTKAIQKWCNLLLGELSASNTGYNGLKNQMMEEMDSYISEIKEHLTKMREETLRKLATLGGKQHANSIQVETYKEKLQSLLRVIYMKAPEETSDLDDYCKNFRQLITITEQTQRLNPIGQLEEFHKTQFKETIQQLKNLQEQCYGLFKRESVKKGKNRPTSTERGSRTDRLVRNA